MHFHIVPRMDNLPEDHRGTEIFKYPGATEWQVSKEKMNEIADKVRTTLLSFPALS